MKKDEFIIWSSVIMVELMFKSELLGKVGCHVRGLFSSKDEMVSLASKAVLQKMPNVVTSILPDSAHYYYSTEDKPAIFREFEALIGIL